jgi:hypothetical protein
MCLTYGQVIAKYTKDYIGPSEMLFGTAISCILMAVLGTEPLAVIAGTAAMMIFESSTYQVLHNGWSLLRHLHLRIKSAGENVAYSLGHLPSYHVNNQS